MVEPIVQPTGKEAGSQPADAANAVVAAAKAAGVNTDIKPDESGSAPATDPNAVKVTEDPNAAKVTEDPKDVVEIEGVKYYKSFDKHPEWDGMRAAKTATNKILEENGYTSMEDLLIDVKSGLDIKALLGEEDAQTILDNSQKWNSANEYWAEEEANKLEQGETATETIARLKDENKSIKEGRQKDQANQQAIEDGKKTITQYDKAVSGVVDGTEDFSDTEKALLKTVLGVDNPMDAIDVADQKAIRLAAKDGSDKFKTFLDKVKQDAVDKYSQGKSEITPVGKSGAEDVKAVETTKIDTSKGVDSSFAQASKLLTELVQGGQASM